MTGKEVFKTLAAISKTNFGCLNEFNDLLADLFEKVGPNKKDIANAIEKIINKLKVSGKIGQEEALKILLARDLEEMLKTLKRIDFEDPEKEIKKYYPIFKKELKKLGFDFELPPIYFVDHFPHPYEKFDFTAMPYDEADHNKHGVNIGIHFIKKNLLPFTAVTILAHELIHVCAAIADCNHFPRNLEEGTCEFFGGYYLSSLVLPKDLVANDIIKKRMKYNLRRPKFEVYTEGMRASATLYKNVGTKGIIEMLKRGRGEIKKVEEQILGFKSNEVDLPKGNWIKDLDNFADFLLSYPRHSLTGSPLARLISEDIEEDAKTGEIIGEKYNKKEAMAAFEELAMEIGPILLTDGFFFSDETKKFIRTNTFRYKIPENLAREIQGELS